MGIHLIIRNKNKGDFIMTTTTNTTNITTGIDCKAFNAYVTQTLKKFADKMPNGVFLDMHNKSQSKCDGLVMTATGDVCPTFHKSSRYWCLNPLYFPRKEDGMVHLSASSCAGVMKIGKLEESVNVYNQGYLNALERGIDQTRFMVIGWLEF